MLSMTGLSYGVVRVDAGEKLSVLTVQDVGQVMPGGKGAPAPADHAVTAAGPAGTQHGGRFLDCFCMEMGILIHSIFSMFCCLSYKFNVELRNKGMFMACEPTSGSSVWGHGDSSHTAAGQFPHLPVPCRGVDPTLDD